MVSTSERSAFPRYILDATPEQCRVLADGFLELRRKLLEGLEKLGVTGGGAEISAVRALQVRLMSADIALEELEESSLKGYGELSEEARRALEEVVSDLGAKLGEMIAFLDEARGRPHAPGKRARPRSPRRWSARLLDGCLWGSLAVQATAGGTATGVGQGVLSAPPPFGRKTLQQESSGQLNQKRRASMAIAISLPDQPTISIEHVVLDFTGTLSARGRLLPGVAKRLATLASFVRIVVMTADTRGTAAVELAGLPVEVRFIATGREKAELVQELGPARVVAIGNGRNDVPMVQLAAIGIAVLGKEGTAGELIRVADVVVPDIGAALDMLLDPPSLVATLRD
jgi:soluble P-type ATPase